ncbi:hypothetical protein GCM10010430_76110 [Kitasatospora cystarginea]|uniref:Uncharacterized protein n=1 Tax=Kitasatospora cystarginea TaxID=58350 RepID=A0ABP5RYQ8_9ACTN
MTRPSRRGRADGCPPIRSLVASYWRSSEAGLRSRWKGASRSLVSPTWTRRPPTPGTGPGLAGAVQPEPGGHLSDHHPGSPNHAKVDPRAFVNYLRRAPAWLLTALHPPGANRI